MWSCLFRRWRLADGAVHVSACACVFTGKCWRAEQPKNMIPAHSKHQAFSPYLLRKQCQSEKQRTHLHGRNLPTFLLCSPSFLPCSVPGGRMKIKSAVLCHCPQHKASHRSASLHDAHTAHMHVHLYKCVFVHSQQHTVRFCSRSPQLVHEAAFEVSTELSTSYYQRWHGIKHEYSA